MENTLQPLISTEITSPTSITNIEVPPSSSALSFIQKTSENVDARIGA